MAPASRPGRDSGRTDGQWKWPCKPTVVKRTTHRLTDLTCVLPTFPYSENNSTLPPGSPLHTDTHRHTRTHRDWPRISVYRLAVSPAFFGVRPFLPSFQLGPAHQHLSHSATESYRQLRSQGKIKLAQHNIQIDLMVTAQHSFRLGVTTVEPCMMIPNLHTRTAYFHTENSSLRVARANCVGSASQQSIRLFRKIGRFTLRYTDNEPIEANRFRLWKQNHPTTPLFPLLSFC